MLEPTPYDTLLHALATATAQCRRQHPELSDADERAAYTTYQRHFAERQDDPPTSEWPAVDDLLLALWDVIVDREERGQDEPEGELEDYYATAFAMLLEPAEAEEAVEQDGAPIAMGESPQPPSNQPAPVVEDDQAENVVEADDTQGQIFTVRISLDGSTPEIWRRVLIPADVPQTELNYIVQAAMGWRGSEQFQFLPPQERELPTSGEPRLRDLLPEVGDDCGYEFDRGATWYHHLALEEIGQAEGRRHYPVCTAGQRACPPEDVGSLREYEEMVKKMKDPTNDEYREMAGWLTQDFNPAAFNIEQANLRLGRHGQVGFQAVV